MTAPIYFDTSALAKWYLNEHLSEEVEAFLGEVLPACISVLTKLEMRSLLARRRREGSIDALTEGRAFSVFEGDIAAGHLILLSQRVEHFLLAESLIGALPEIPLRSLDALHLGVIQGEGIGALATADRVMAQAAGALGLECHTFF
jgi:predicted nucleic acid-binding protein